MRKQLFKQKKDRSIVAKRFLSPIALIAICLLPLSSFATTFELEHAVTNYAPSGYGFGSGGGADDELYFLGTVVTTGNPEVKSSIIGDVGSKYATLSFDYTFDLVVRTDLDSNGTFDSISDAGTMTFTGRDIRIEAVDGDFNGVFEGADGWEKEQWFSTEKDFGTWSSGLATFTNNGYGGLNPLIGKARNDGASIFYDGTSILSWLSLQYAPWADISLDVLSTQVSFQPDDNPNASVPEPATATLLVVGALGALRKRKELN